MENMENKIEFHTQLNPTQDSWVMRITADRRIEVNADVEVTEAAQKVLAAMQHLLMAQRTAAEGEDTRRAWAGLTDEDDIDWDGTGNLKQLVEAVEAKLREKNSL